MMFKVDYHANPEELAKAVSKCIKADIESIKEPGKKFRIDFFIVTDDGDLEFDDRADSREIEWLFMVLERRGFRI